MAGIHDHYEPPAGRIKSFFAGIQMTIGSEEHSIGTTRGQPRHQGSSSKQRRTGTGLRMNPRKLVTVKATARKTFGAAAIAGLVSLAGCSSGGGTAAAPARTDATVAVRNRSSTVPVAGKGRRVAGLDFVVPTTGLAAAAPGSTVPASVAPNSASAATARGAAAGFLDRAIVGDFTGAWAFLSAADRARLAGPAALAEQFAAGGWKSFRLKDSTADRVTVDVVQTARIGEIVGLVSPTATVTFPVSIENGSHLVSWVRRSVEQHFPDRSPVSDGQVRAAVLKWAESRQQCGPPANEYASGLLGVVGLGEALCHKNGTEVADGVGDLDALDEPEPIIAGFGGSALSWARVVTLSGPVPMRVVAAPVGDGWTVIGLARATSAAP